MTKTYPELAIIGPELSARVQLRVGVRKTPGAPRQPRTSNSFALSGLLRCGACGGSFGIVGQAKRDGKVYRTLGCGAHKDHRCTSSRTISERKVVTALTDFLRDRLSRPDRVKTFVTAFEKRFEQLEAEESPAKALEEQVERQRQTIAAIFQNMAVAPGSKMLGEKLVSEEKRLAELEAQVQALRVARPKVLPHPAAIAKYVSELAETLESQDPGAAGAVLRRALAPFRMVPEGTGYRMTGALDVSVCSEIVAGA